MSGTDWSGPYPSSRFDDIDVELRLVRPGVVRILVDEEDFGEVTAERVAELAVLSKLERTVGPFQVTSKVGFDGPLEVDFDVDLLVRFMGHDFATGEFDG